MTVYYNSTNSSGTGTLQSATLSPTSQIISAVVSDAFDEGANIDYFINGTYQTSYFDSTIAQTGDINTSAGNTYKFIGSNGGI
jgi:hypothetical protein